MDMLTALQRSGGIEALARQAGVAPPDALAAARQMLPGLLAMLRGFGQGRGALFELLERLGGTSLAADVMSVDQVQSDRGQALLSELAGASETGEGPLRPLLAMLVCGYVAAQAAGHGAGPDAVENLLAG